jgi:uncharacterized coiled-coil DUF342 family protein
MNADKIKQIVAERDGKFRAIDKKVRETVDGLQAEFDRAHQELARTFVEREKKARVEADEAFHAAVVEFDAQIEAATVEPTPEQVAADEKVKSNNGKAVGKTK